MKKILLTFILITLSTQWAYAGNDKIERNFINGTSTPLSILLYRKGTKTPPSKIALDAGETKTIQTGLVFTVLAPSQNKNEPQWFTSYGSSQASELTSGPRWITIYKDRIEPSYSDPAEE